jgi:hypothetical protein
MSRTTKFINFTTGQKVRIIKPLASTEVFEIVSWNDSQNQGRVQDGAGETWKVFADEIELVEDVEEWDDGLDDDD